MGLLTYAFLAVGLGCWLKGPSRSGLDACGLRLAVGYAAMIILLYFLEVIARVEVGPALWIVGAIAGAGLGFRSWACRGRIDWRSIARHPASILLVAGGVAILANGGIGYLPVGYDEFSHWIANPLRINAFGGWAAARDSIHLVGYPPGWSLLLSLPWQPLAEVDLGASAAAPFVLHVAAIALIFDLVAFLVRRHLDLGPGRSEIAGLGVHPAVPRRRSAGPVVATTLLIEPPQILGNTVFILLLFATEVAPRDERTLEASAGVVLARAI